MPEDKSDGCTLSKTPTLIIEVLPERSLNRFRLGKHQKYWGQERWVGYGCSSWDELGMRMISKHRCDARGLNDDQIIKHDWTGPEFNSRKC